MNYVLEEHFVRSNFLFSLFGLSSYAIAVARLRLLFDCPYTLMGSRIMQITHYS